MFDGQIREKPRDADEARAFIRSYADAPATTVGACVCACLDTGVQYEDVDINQAHIEKLPDDTIEQLIAEGDVFKCAGGRSLCAGGMKMIVRMALKSSMHVPCSNLSLLMQLEQQASLLCMHAARQHAFAGAWVHSLQRSTHTLRTLHTGLMIEHPLVQKHVRGIEGSIDGIMGLSRNAFMRVLLKTVADSMQETSPDKQ